ncbi:hypothetical protein AB0B31_15125 [Catellatospora citrea]|uniref:hypothetical protein n=1 Tax=Catellatospora citrea TaxID=53366 RepID=UPI0033CD584B
MTAMKSLRAIAGPIVPVGMTLADAPGWVIAGAFVLALAHRILPQDSKDLLTLWLRVFLSRRDTDEEPKNGSGK